MENYDIIILAGQSNADGNGISLDKTRFVVENAYELVDKNPYTLNYNEDNSYKSLTCVMPVQTFIRPLQEKDKDPNGHYVSDFSLYFAQKYIDKGLLKKGHKLLVVKAAVGGSGFALKQQGVGNILYERLLQMTHAALELGKDSRIVAFLWHQGEHDAYENLSLTDEQRYEFYYGKLLEQLTCFRKEFKQFHFPIITAGFCLEWKKTMLSKCEAVEKATKDVCDKIGFADFIDTSTLTSNNQEIQNGDNIHFSKVSLIKLGGQYFDSYLKLINHN